MMLGHNSAGIWEMPGEFDTYVAHFNAAKAAWARFYVATAELYSKAEQLRRTPALIAQPNFGAIPTQQQLIELYNDAQQKAAPLMGAYNALPNDVKQYAPQPQTATQR